MWKNEDNEDIEKILRSLCEYKRLEAMETNTYKRSYILVSKPALKVVFCDLFNKNFVGKVLNCSSIFIV